MKRRTLFILLRIVISLTLIGYLLRSANLSELIDTVRAANWWWLLAALALQIVCLLLSTYRWQVLLSAQNMLYRFALLNSFNLVGRFFNTFLPTAQGGDVMRMYELAKHSHRGADSIISVLADRLLGLLALFIICWVALAAGGWRLLEGTNILLIIAVLSLAFVLALVILLNQRLVRVLISLARIIRVWNLESRLIRICGSLQDLIKHRRTLAHVFGAALLMQCIHIISIYLTGLAVDVSVHLSFYLIVTPLTWVIIMLPISIAGLGVREGAFVFFFGQQGISAASALSLSLLVFGQALIIALTGGIIYGLGRYRRHTMSAVG